MRARSLLSVAVALAAFAAGRASLAGDSPAATVKAQRYRIVYAESGCDLVHGGGEWVHEIFLPDAKVAATLVFETRTKPVVVGKPVEFEEVVHVVVNRADEPRNDLTGFHDPKPSAIEEVDVPADLAAALAAQAALSERFFAEGRRLGADVRTRLRLEPIPKAE
jgi:hypothetical protein